MVGNVPDRLGVPECREGCDVALDMPGRVSGAGAAGPSDTLRRTDRLPVASACREHVLVACDGPAGLSCSQGGTLCRRDDMRLSILG